MPPSDLSGPLLPVRQVAPRRTPPGPNAPQWSLVWYLIRRIRFYGSHPVVWAVGAITLVLLLVVGLIGQEPKLTTREARLAAVSAVYEGLAEPALAMDHKRIGAPAIKKRYGVEITLQDLPTYRQNMHEALEIFAMGEDDAQVHMVRQLLNSQLEIGGELVTGHHLDHELPQTVYTVSPARDKEHWKLKDWEVLNPDWKLERFSDGEGMLRYVKKRFASESADGIKVAAPVVDIFQTRFKRVIQRIDVFRLMLLFWEGGVWVDADAVPLRPLARFPGLWENARTRNIADRTLLRLAESARLAEKTGLVDKLLHGDISMSAVARAVRADLRSLTGASSAPPRLIVAFEHDATSSKKDWREVPLPRGMQLCTWTMIARKYHPVFLDAMSRTFHKLEQWEANPALAPTGENVVLELGGPATLSDAVWTYIYARWGLTPDQVGLRGRREMVRVGDVLFYPDGAFHGWGWNASEPYATLTDDFTSNATWPGLRWPLALVHHAYSGLWRDEFESGAGSEVNTAAAEAKQAAAAQEKHVDPGVKGGSPADH